MSDCLLIFTKNPHLGRVKTRLASTMGDVEALRIYQLLLERTRQTAIAVPVRRMVFYSDFIDEKDAWSSPDFEKHLQEGDDLGMRMASAFETAFRIGAGKAVIIGADCPGLTPEILTAAFNALDQAPFVLGPANDGGYYLLGMRSATPSLFSDMSWSVDTVARVTLERIGALGAQAILLPELTDVDTEADLLSAWPDYPR